MLRGIDFFFSCFSDKVYHLKCASSLTPSLLIVAAIEAPVRSVPYTHFPSSYPTYINSLVAAIDHTKVFLFYQWIKPLAFLNLNIYYYRYIALSGLPAPSLRLSYLVLGSSSSPEVVCMGIFDYWGICTRFGIHICTLWWMRW